MQAAIDLVLFAILVLCIWSGYKKGLIMGIGGLLAIVIALFGANVLADTFSYDVIPALRPFASGYMESRIEANNGALDQLGWSDSGRSLTDLLAAEPEETEHFFRACYTSVGIDEEPAAVMAERAAEYLSANDTDAVSAAVQILCETVTWVACFTIAFLMLLIILTVIGNLPNLSYKIPQMDILNDVMGMLFGAVTGIAFCMLLVWFLRFAGLIIGENTLNGGILIHIFYEHDLLPSCIGI